MVRQLKKYFITGLIVILPLVISGYIIFVSFRFIDGILGHVINIYTRKHFGISIPGLGLFLFLFIILFFGFISIHFFGRQLHRLVGGAAEKFPILRSIYPWIKQTFEFLFSENQLAFKKAVLVEYPSKGVWSLGFITNESFKEAKEKTQQELLNIYIPFVPNPLTGFIAFIPRRDVTVLDISIKEAMKLIISGGLLNPETAPDAEVKD